MEGISHSLPVSVLDRVIRDSGVSEQRVRKRPALLTRVMCLAMKVYSELGLKDVWVRLVRGTRWLSGLGVEVLANQSAISTARYRLGVAPLAALFKQVGQPLAEAVTLGALAYGWRWVALEGRLEEVAHTPDNAAAFGRSSNPYGPGACPPVRTVDLCEGGSHILFDAHFGRYDDAERAAGRRRRLRSVTAQRLVMLDSGRCDFATLNMLHTKRQAQVLARWPSGTPPLHVKTLPDGTWLAYRRPSDSARRTAGERLLVRVIEYSLDDPTRPGHAHLHRLVSTLLDPICYPALDLVCLYHERWEVEITIDQIDTHPRLTKRPLRSLKPEGLIQEWYGLLLAHFVIRSILHQAALQHALNPDRLSCVSSLRLIADALPDFQITHPIDPPALGSRLLNDLCHGWLPPRDNRINPRVVQRRLSKFPLTRPAHFSPPHPTRPFCQTIVLRP